MMRMHFSDADLRRITLAPAPNALLETMLSVRRLRVAPTDKGRSRPGIQQWHRRVNGSLADRAGVLLDLIPREGLLPGFLVQPAADDLDTGVELVRHTPVPHLAADLSLRSPCPQKASRWLQELTAGAAGARQTLASDLRGYFDSTLAPLWRQVRADAVTDRALRAETLLRGGVDALLATLNTHWHWRPPTLHIPGPGTYDIELGGRGLVLIPSYFTPGPMMLHWPGEPTVLAYPMHLGDRPTCMADALGPLLGRTRAAILAILRDPATTTAVAERAGISLGSVSQHTAVLRNARLISTTRMGGAVLHTLTPLGSALFHGDSAASARTTRTAATKQLS
jgi:DNA-binding transcriptional ArsR family regulator